MANDIFDGNRVFTAASNATASSADMNELQDQVIAAVEARYISLFPAGAVRFGGSINDWDLDTGGDFLEAVLGSSDGAIWVVPVPLRVGEVLTSIEIEISGAAGATGGQIVLRNGARGAALTGTVLDAGGNIWDTSGTAYGNRTTITFTAAPLPLTTVAGGLYFLTITAATNASTNDCRLWDYRIETEFGNN